MEKSLSFTEIRSISFEPVQNLLRKNVLYFRPYFSVCFGLHFAFSSHQKPAAEI